MDDIAKLETAIGKASLLRSTPDVSRRWFLIGAGAAVAAAAVAPVLVESDVKVWRLSPRFDWREIYELSYAARPGSVVTFELLRGGNVVHNVSIGPGAMYRWYALSNDRIVMGPADCITIRVEPADGCEAISICYNADRDGCRSFFEAFDGVSGGYPFALNAGDEDWSPLGSGTILQRLGRVLGFCRHSMSNPCP